MKRCVFSVVFFLKWGLAVLLLTFRACCCAGIQSSFSPNVSPIANLKLKIKQKAEQWTFSRNYSRTANKSRFYSVCQR